MVGKKQIVIDSLGNTDYSYIVTEIIGEFSDFCYGIHRIVSAYVKEISYVIFSKNSEYSFINGNICIRARFKARELKSARAESRRGSTLKHIKPLRASQRLSKIYYAPVKEPLYAVSHSKNLSYIFVGKRASDNARKRCVYCRGRTARLPNDSISL